MEEQERFGQQNVKYRAYIQALNFKFDSLPVEQRDIALGEIESLLSVVLKLDKNSLTDGIFSFNYKLAKEIRAREGLTQAELAKKLGISKRAIERYESSEIQPGKRAQPQFKKYYKWVEDSMRNLSDLRTI